jgi:hypothetical protein
VHTLFIYDRSNVSSSSSKWIEIPKDEGLLKRIHYPGHYEYRGLPFICYDAVVSPLVHA